MPCFPGSNRSPQSVERYQMRISQRDTPLNSVSVTRISSRALRGIVAKSTLSWRPLIAASSEARLSAEGCSGQHGANDQDAFAQASTSLEWDGRLCEVRISAS